MLTRRCWIVDGIFGQGEEGHAKPKSQGLFAYVSFFPLEYENEVC
jgi:hypothetical protein